MVSVIQKNEVIEKICRDLFAWFEMRALTCNLASSDHFEIDSAEKKIIVM